MDASPLGRLPPELRNHIYELALTEPHGIVLDVQKAAVAARRHHRHACKEYSEYTELCLPLPATALLRVCRQIRREAHGLYFLVNKLVVQMWFERNGWPDVLEAWAHMVGPEYFQMLRAVEVVLGFYYTSDLGLAHYWHGLSHARRLLNPLAELDYTFWNERGEDNDGEPHIGEMTIPFGRPSQARQCIRDQVQYNLNISLSLQKATPAEMDKHVEGWVRLIGTMRDPEKSCERGLVSVHV